MYKPAFYLLLFLIPTIATYAIKVEIRTDSRRDVRGEVTRIDNGFLYLTTDDYQTLGIPLNNIATLKPARGTDLNDVAGEMLQFREMLHLWDAGIQMNLITFLESLASKLEWNACFQSASTIETCSRDPEVISMASELRAFALFKMGLFAQCGEALKLAESPDYPLQVSVRVCWMKAQLALRDGDTEKAVFWALVPTLRIPREESRLADQLQKECRKWLDPN